MLRQLLIVGLCCLIGGCALDLPKTGEIAGGDDYFPVLFTYVDAHASKVCVAGSFNGWSSETHLMERHGDLWSVEVPLPYGRYEYLFVVDDRVWKPDPGNLLSEDNGFGTRNSILVVE